MGIWGVCFDFRVWFGLDNGPFGAKANRNVTGRGMMQSPSPSKA